MALTVLYNTMTGDTTQDVNSSISNTNYPSTSPQPEFLPCNNPRNILSPHVAEMVDLVLYVGLVPVLVTYGVITNVINMAVFARLGLSDRINLCLFSLALSDTCYLLFLMCAKSYAIVSLLDPVAGNFWHVAHHGSVLATLLACLAISNVITAIVAVERCLCVLSPLKAARVFRVKYMRMVMVAVAVYILAVVNVALTLKYQTVQGTDPVTNTTLFYSRLSPFYVRHRAVIDIVYNHMLLVTVPVLSLIVVVICTIAIVLRLKVTATWRRAAVSSMTSGEKQEVTVTRMLVTVCCVYIICMTPSVTRQLNRVPGYYIGGHLCNFFRVTIALSHLLEVVNASSNFLIYLKQSSRYRAALKRLCGCVASVRVAKKDDSST